MIIQVIWFKVGHILQILILNNPYGKIMTKIVIYGENVRQNRFSTKNLFHLFVIHVSARTQEYLGPQGRKWEGKVHFRTSGRWVGGGSEKCKRGIRV